MIVSVCTVLFLLTPFSSIYITCMYLFMYLSIYWYNLLDVNEDYVREMVQQMIDDLQGRQSQKSLIELRIEELEQRVTEHNDNYQVGVSFLLHCSNYV